MKNGVKSVSIQKPSEERQCYSPCSVGSAIFHIQAPRVNISGKFQTRVFDHILFCVYDNMIQGRNLDRLSYPVSYYAHSFSFSSLPTSFREKS